MKRVNGKEKENFDIGFYLIMLVLGIVYTAAPFLWKKVDFYNLLTVGLGVLIIISTILTQEKSSSNKYPAC